jgi:hypothetical protein
MLLVGQQPTKVFLSLTVSLFFWGERINQRHLFFTMQNAPIILYGNPTLSDLDYIMEPSFTSFPSEATSTSSSTLSDAQSAPPDLDLLFNKICDEYSRCVHEAGRLLPPEWTMPDLVRTMLGDEAIQHGFLTDAYYDVMLCGTHSWGCEELLNLLDLINYTF